MSARKESIDLAQQCERLGCGVSKTKRGHWRIVCPDGSVIHTPYTPGDWRALKNARALLRRHGVEVR